MSDESVNWTREEIAIQQRELVDQQLDSMMNGHAPHHFEVIGSVVKWLKNHSKARQLTLLDAGCASAYYWQIVEHYLPGFFKYTGVDFSFPMLELAGQYYPDIELIQADLRMMTEIGTDSYQVVMSGAALMHIKEWERVLVDLARISSDWLLLHRTWLLAEPGPTQIKIGQAYGHCVWYITFEFDQVLAILDECGFALKHSRFSGEDAGPGKNVMTLLFRKEDSCG